MASPAQLHCGGRACQKTERRPRRPKSKTTRTTRQTAIWRIGEKGKKDAALTGSLRSGRCGNGILLRMATFGSDGSNIAQTGSVRFWVVGGFECAAGATISILRRVLDERRS